MDILYHYCSNFAFKEILKTRSIWLSSLSLSNDYMEGELLSGILNNLINNDFSDCDYTKDIQSTIVSMQKQVDGLGFCLSEDGDLLSQWRGYADNAQGVSIGFSRTHLEKLVETQRKSSIPNLVLEKVTYDSIEQESMIEPAYQEIKSILHSSAYKPSHLRSSLDTKTEDEIRDETNQHMKCLMKILGKLTVPVRNKLFLLKGTGFKEEREWRLLTHVRNGMAIAKEDFNHVLYRSTANHLVPYKILDNLDDDIIKEVILGPKNITPKSVAYNFIRQSGFNFKPLALKSSSASYR